MVRVIAVALLSLLLVGAQREALVHDVDHLRARVAQGHDVVLQNAGTGACAQCALLASGGAPVPGAASVAGFCATRAPSVPTFATLAPAAAAQVPYSSRAPPAFL